MYTCKCSIELYPIAYTPYCPFLPYTVCGISYIYTPIHVLHFLHCSTVLLQVCSRVLGFFLLLIMSNHYSSHKSALKALSICLWFFAILNVGVYIFGSLTLPIVSTLFLSALIASLVTTTKKEIGKLKSHVIGRHKNDDEEGLLEKGLSTETLHRLISQDSELEAEARDTDTPVDIEEDAEGSVFQEVENSEQKVAVAHAEETSGTRKQVSFNPAVGIAHTASQDSTSAPLNSPVGT